MSFRAEIEALFAGYLRAYAAEDAARCAEVYADDAVIYTPWGPPTRGRKAIAAAHEDWFTLAENNKRIAVIDCGGSGELAYCVIRYSADVSTGDGLVAEEAGTNLCVMAREDVGWRIRRSSMNEEKPE